MINNIHIADICRVFILLIMGYTGNLTAQAPSLQESGTPATSSSKEKKAQTLCETLGHTAFTIEIGEGSSSGIVNSAQLGTLPLHPKIRIVGNFSVIQNAPLTLTGATININPMVVIEVQSSLVLDSCKLFACDNLWKGIKMISGSTVKTLNHTVIEDAEAAIQGDDIEHAYLELENTTFNRNRLGLRFENARYLPHAVAFLKFSGNKFSCTAPLNGTTDEMATTGIRVKNIYTLTNN